MPFKYSSGGAPIFPVLEEEAFTSGPAGGSKKQGPIL
jgi:hypothetical protein